MPSSMSGSSVARIAILRHTQLPARPDRRTPSRRTQSCVPNEFGPLEPFDHADAGDTVSTLKQSPSDKATMMRRRSMRGPYLGEQRGEGDSSSDGSLCPPREGCETEV